MHTQAVSSDVTLHTFDPLLYGLSLSRGGDGQAGKPVRSRFHKFPVSAGAFFFSQHEIPAEEKPISLPSLVSIDSQTERHRTSL